MSHSCVEKINCSYSEICRTSPSCVCSAVWKIRSSVGTLLKLGGQCLSFMHLRINEETQTVSDIKEFLNVLKWSQSCSLLPSCGVTVAVLSFIIMVVLMSLWCDDINTRENSREAETQPEPFSLKNTSRKYLNIKLYTYITCKTVIFDKNYLMERNSSYF